MKVAVVGSRTLKIDNLQDYLPEKTDVIISGGAKGIDTCAAEYCESNSLTIKTIRPDYKRYGKAAPLLRNKEIVSEADFVLIFWDGVSKGTRFVIDECKKQSKEHKVYIIEKSQA